MINRLCRLGSLWLRTLAASAFLSAATSTVFAQAVPTTDPVPRVVFPITPSSNSYTFGPRTADAANAAKFSFGVAANGSVFANTGAQLPTPGGASIPIGVNGSISKPNVAAAVGRALRKIAPVAYPLQVGSALYDLAKELGYDLQYDGSQVSVTKPSTVGIDSGCGNPPPSIYPAPGTGCYGQYHGGIYFIVNSIKKEGGTCRAYGTCSDGRWPNTGLGSYPVTGLNPTASPSNITELENAIASKSGWPSSSALARATVEAINAGESLQVQPETLTGPASSPGPSSTTVNATNNTSTTTNTTYNYNYEGAKVTVTTTTTTTVRDLSTNEVLSQETKTEQPELTCPL